MLIRIGAIIVLSLMLAFPSVLVTDGHLVTENDRLSSFGVSEDDSGILSIDQPESISEDSSSERLVGVENQASFKQNISVSLEDGIGWKFDDGTSIQSRTNVSKSQEESFFVNTTRVSGATSGKYTIESKRGSFILRAERYVEFVSSGFNVSVGGNETKALIDINDTDGEIVLVDSNRVYPSGGFDVNINNSLVTASEKSSCSSSAKKDGECPIYIQPNSKGDSLVTVSDTNNNQDSIKVTSTSSPFRLELVVSQEPTEGQGNVKINGKISNNGDQTRNASVRINPGHTSSIIKDYTGISGTTSKTFSFSTSVGEEGHYVAGGELFEYNSVGGNTVSQDSVSYNIKPTAGIKISNTEVQVNDGTVYEGEDLKYSIKVSNQASSQRSDTIEISHPDIGTSSKDVTLNSGESSEFNMTLETDSNDQGQYDVNAISESNSVSMSTVTVKDGDAEIDYFYIDSLNKTSPSGGSNVTYKMKGETPRNNENVINVTLEIIVNGNTQRDVFLIKNRSLTKIADDGVMQKQDAKFQDSNPVLFELPDKLVSGDTIESVLIVEQTNGLTTTKKSFNSV